MTSAQACDYRVEAHTLAQAVAIAFVETLVPLAAVWPTADKTIGLMMEVPQVHHTAWFFVYRDGSITACTRADGKTVYRDDITKDDMPGVILAMQEHIARRTV